MMKTPILSELRYQEEMDRIAPQLKEQCEKGSFERVKGEPIYYELYTRPENMAWVAISHGFTENTVKYAEMIWYFLEEGYNVAMPDHRGHGQSYRGVEENWLVHVRSFDDYSDDFAYFIQTVVLPRLDGKPLYLMSHSMGGAVAAHLLERYPDLPFEKAVLGSPMLCPQTQPLPHWVTELVARLFCLIGKGNQCVFVHHPYTPKSDFGEPWCCATSKPRHHWYHTLQLDNDHLHSCAASYSWLKESLRQSRAVLRQANIDKICVPVLLIQAEKDNSVENAAQDVFISRLKGGRKLVFPDALHEIMRGNDAQAEKFMDAILDFYQE